MQPTYFNKQTRLHQDVAAWFGSAPGRRLLHQEESVLAGFSEGLFGYYLAQVQGFGHTLDWFAESPIRYKFQLSLIHEKSAFPSIQACSEVLPLATDSIDTVILPHTLDFALDPHRVLREVERVLIPQGRVIILGFNPFSLWGLYRLILRHRNQALWQGHFISYRHISDWLNVLGFDIELSDVCAFAPPITHAHWADRMAWLETFGRRSLPGCAGVYALRAVKRVSTVKPIKMRMQRLRVFKPGNAVAGKVSLR